MADFEVQPQDGDPISTSRFSAISPSQSDTQATPKGLDAEDVATINALPATSALLIARSGANAGARFLLNDDSTTVGRHPKSDIFLDDVTVSRRHVEFLREGDGFVVRDVGSLNGTYVNRERIDHARLRAEDEVQIGKFRLTYHPSPAVSEPAGQ